MSSSKRGHNTRTQARNSRGQFAPRARCTSFDYDTDVDGDPATMRLALEVWSTGGKRGKGAASSGGKEKVSVSSAKRGQMGAFHLIEEGKSDFPPLVRCVRFGCHSELESRGLGAMSTGGAR